MARFTVTFTEVSTYKATIDGDAWDIPATTVDEIWDYFDRDNWLLDDAANEYNWTDSDPGSIEIIDIQEAE